MVTLKVVPAHGDVFSYSVDRDEVVIGRSTTADLSVSDRSLSRRHARLFRSGEDWMIEDLGSRNGTFVNGQAVTAPTPVRSGDEITLSASTIRVAGRASSSVTTPRREILGAGSIFRQASDLVESSTHLLDSSKDTAPEGLRRFAERLGILNGVHETLATSLDLGDLLDTILDRTTDYLKPQHGAVYLRDSAGELYPVARRPRTSPEEEFAVSLSLAREVVDGGMAALVQDVRVDDRFAGSQSLVDAGIRSLVAAPLADPRGTLGMIVLSSSANVRVFSEDDLQLLSSLASVAALRIRNLELMEEALERRRLEGELVLARRIQLALIPGTLPEIPGAEVFGRNWPSRGVSGDYYEVIERRDGAEYALFIADVSGKGIGASLLTGYIEALAVSPIEDGLTPAEVFTRVSNRLYRRTLDDQFATAVLAVLDPTTGVVRYSSAGHHPVLVLREDGSAEWLRSTSPPLGLVTVDSFDEAECTLAGGDILVLFTDGITEAMNPDGEEYGPGRLRELCRRCRDLPLVELADRLDEDLETFAAGVEFADDRTLVMARRSG